MEREENTVKKEDYRKNRTRSILLDVTHSTFSRNALTLSFYSTGYQLFSPNLLLNLLPSTQTSSTQTSPSLVSFGIPTGRAGIRARRGQGAGQKIQSGSTISKTQQGLLPPGAISTHRGQGSHNLTKTQQGLLYKSDYQSYYSPLTGPAGLPLPTLTFHHGGKSGPGRPPRPTPLGSGAPSTTARAPTVRAGQMVIAQRGPTKESDPKRGKSPPRPNALGSGAHPRPDQLARLPGPSPGPHQEPPPGGSSRATAP